MPSVNFNTVERTIRFALKNAGMLEDGEDPSSEQLADGLNRLNDMVNLWQTQGIKLWLNRLITVNLVVGQANYTLPLTFLGYEEQRVLEGYFIDSTGISRPLEGLSWNTWNNLPNKNQQGSITNYFVDKQLASPVVWFWLTPDPLAATGSVQLLVQDAMPNYNGLTDTSVFPSEWAIALQWGLADEICTGQPDAIVQRCATKAHAYREALEAWDTEDPSVSFAPNFEGQSTQFR